MYLEENPGYLPPERQERGGLGWLLKLRQMGTHRVQMKRVLPWLVNWARRASTRDFWFCLGCSSRPSTKYFFLTVNYFTSFVPIAQQAGHAVVPRRLSLNTCLCIRLQKQIISGEFPLCILFPWLSVCIQYREGKECANLWAVRGTMTCNFSRGCIGVGVQTALSATLDIHHPLCFFVLTQQPEFKAQSLR